MRRRRALTAALLVMAGLFIAEGLSAGPGVREAQPPVAAAPVATVKPVAVGTRRLPLAPDRASPVASPLATANEVVAVTLNKDNKVALIDPTAGRVSRTIDAGMAPGTLALAPDNQ